MQVGKYKLIARVGSGGMGTVFRAVDEFGGHVAIKFIGSQAVINATLHAGTTANMHPALHLGNRMMLVREARLAMGLTHPNIVRVFDYGQHQGLLYIVMEFLHGLSLDKAGFPPLPIRFTRIRQLCEALDYAHRRGVIHRDVKPANCFVTRTGDLKVLDFGIASRADQRPGQFPLAGTPHYMAPELFWPSPQYTEKVDIWAAGVTLYQLITGKLPFDGRSFTEIARNITHLSARRLSQSVPHGSELQRIFDRALAKNPDHRYATAAEFARDLAQLVAIEEGTSRAASIDIEPSAGTHGSETIALHESPTSAPLPNSRNGTISMISGEIRARRGGHVFRFTEYVQRITPWVVMGILFGGSYAIFSIAGGDSSALFNVLGYGWAWELFAYVSGFLVPFMVVLTVALGGLAIWENIAGRPRCRRCNAMMTHQSGVVAYSHTEVAWRHASSDCLAALREDLWEDASRLLSMHGDLDAPEPGTKTQRRVLQLSLDIYTCGGCADQTAVLSTADRIGGAWKLLEEDGTGRAWKLREEFEGAYKEMPGPGSRPTRFDQVKRTFQAARRASQLAAKPVHPALASILIVAGFLFALYYYPQIPFIMGLRVYQASVTIQSDPPGQFIVVDRTEILAPHRFMWTVGSSHTIKFDRRSFHLDGKYYVFTGIYPQSKNVRLYGADAADSEFGGTLTVEAVKDRWGRPTQANLDKTYTFAFAPAEDPAAVRARALKAFSNELGSGGQSTIRIKSDPPGLDVIVDGVRVTTPKSYTWEIGTIHELIAPEGSQRRLDGKYYVFTGTYPQSKSVRLDEWNFDETYTFAFAPSEDPAASRSRALKNVFDWSWVQTPAPKLSKGLLAKYAYKWH